MNCAQRNCVYALLAGLWVCLSASQVMGKDDNKLSDSTFLPQFQWNEHTKLSWNDFRGVVNAPHDESAAATYCSIGFKTNVQIAGGRPEITVYNTFYPNKSWVRDDAKIQSILDHEQGHFDLCEIYTRKLRERISNFDLSVPGMKQELMNIYSEISNEYETRQQAYEQETIHGTNIAEQKRWQEIIADELIYKVAKS